MMCKRKGSLGEADSVINKGFGSFGRITERKITPPRTGLIKKSLRRR